MRRARESLKSSPFVRPESSDRPETQQRDWIHLARRGVLLAPIAVSHRLTRSHLLSPQTLTLYESGYHRGYLGTTGQLFHALLLSPSRFWLSAVAILPRLTGTDRAKLSVRNATILVFALWSEVVAIPLFLRFLQKNRRSPVRQDAVLFPMQSAEVLDSPVLSPAGVCLDEAEKRPAQKNGNPVPGHAAKTQESNSADTRSVCHWIASQTFWIESGHHHGRLGATEQLFHFHPSFSSLVKDRKRKLERIIPYYTKKR